MEDISDFLLNGMDGRFAGFDLNLAQIAIGATILAYGMRLTAFMMPQSCNAVKWEVRLERLPHTEVISKR